MVNNLPTNTPDAFDLVDLFAALLEIFARCTKQDRVIMPLFEMLDVLFGIGAVARLGQ